MELEKEKLTILVGQMLFIQKKEKRV